MADDVPLPLLVVLSALVLLPAVNSKFRTLLTARYLMPLVPLLFACAAVAFVGLVVRLQVALAAVGSARGRVVVPLAAALTLVLVLGPLLPLARSRLAAGRLELRGLLDAVATSYFGPDELARVDPSGRALTNVNTPEDLARAEALLSGA